MELQIKQLGFDDEERIMQIISNAFAEEPWNDDWHDQENFHRYLLDLMGNDNSIALGLVAEGVLVGIALGHLIHWFNGIEYCLDDFCIDRAYQGQGIGSQWVQLVKEYGRQNGFHRLSLRTHRQAPAYHFYLKNGFHEMKNDVYFVLNCD